MSPPPPGYYYGMQGGLFRDPNYIEGGSAGGGGGGSDDGNGSGGGSDESSSHDGSRRNHRRVKRVKDEESASPGDLRRLDAKLLEAPTVSATTQLRKWLRTIRELVEPIGSLFLATWDSQLSLAMANHQTYLTRTTIDEQCRPEPGSRGKISTSIDRKSTRLNSSH